MVWRNPKTGEPIHGKRGPAKVTYTYEDIARAVGLKVKSVKTAASSPRNEFDFQDLVSVAEYIVRKRSETPKAPTSGRSSEIEPGKAPKSDLVDHAADPVDQGAFGTSDQVGSTDSIEQEGAFGDPSLADLADLGLSDPTPAVPGRDDLPRCSCAHKPRGVFSPTHRAFFCSTCGGLIRAL